MREKSLAVSKRDRQLLSILLAVVILFLLYIFLAGPSYDESLLIKAEITTVQSTLQSMNETVEKAPEMKQQISSKREELQEKYQVFLYAIDGARLLNQIDGIMTATNFAANSYQQSGKIVSNVEVLQSAYQPNNYPLLELAKKLNPSLTDESLEVAGEGAVDAQPEEISLANTVEQTEIAIGFTNIGYTVLYSFIAALEGLERSYILSDISMGSGEQATGLQGQVLLKAIALPKINETESNDLVFQPTIPTGKTSPF